MADNVPVDSTAAYTVAADDIGGVAYQRVKVQVGADGVVGDVDATNPLPVTGTVSVSGPVQVSGTVTIAPTTFTVNTVGNGLSVSAVVSGTVSVLNVVPVTTAASVSVTALPVWLSPTQPVVVNTIAAGFSVNALVTGAVSVSAMPAVSISVSAVLGTIVTQLGTQMVSIAQTSVSIAALPTVNTIVAVSGVTAVSVVSTIVTILGTQVVSQVGLLYTTTAVTTGTAQAVWIMNPTTVTATVTVSQPFGDAISFSFTSVSAPTVQTPANMDVAWLGTTVQTSMYVVPDGRRLRINGIVVQVQNTAAPVGFARAEVYIRASVSSSVTVGPVVGYAFAGAPTSATNAGGGNMVNLAVDISTTLKVGFAYKVTGGTGHIIGFVVMGNLF